MKAIGNAKLQEKHDDISFVWKHVKRMLLRIQEEFHKYNNDYVIGLREGSMLHIKGVKIVLKGSTGARVFQKDSEPIEYKPGNSLDFLNVKT